MMNSPPVQQISPPFFTIKKITTKFNHYRHRTIEVLYYHHTIEGLTALIKVSVPTMELYDKLRGSNHFKLVTPDLNPLKNLYYATSFISTFREAFITKEGKAFQIPKYQGGLDCAKILNLIGDVSETARFIQKQRLYSFSFLCHLGHKYGSLQLLPNLKGGWVELKEIPYLNCLLHKPKDFFVLSSCLVKLYRFSNLNSEEKKEWDRILELANGIGKMTLILAGPFVPASKDWTGIIFAILDLGTNMIGASRSIKKMQLPYCKCNDPHTSLYD